MVSVSKNEYDKTSKFLRSPISVKMVKTLRHHTPKVQKVIIPKGTIDPDHDTVVEIPVDIKQGAVVVASRKFDKQSRKKVLTPQDEYLLRSLGEQCQRDCESHVCNPGTSQLAESTKSSDKYMSFRKNVEDKGVQQNISKKDFNVGHKSRYQHKSKIQQHKNKNINVDCQTVETNKTQGQFDDCCCCFSDFCSPYLFRNPSQHQYSNFCETCCNFNCKDFPINQRMFDVPKDVLKDSFMKMCQNYMSNNNCNTALYDSFNKLYDSPNINTFMNFDLCRLLNVCNNDRPEKNVKLLLKYKKEALDDLYLMCCSNVDLRKNKETEPYWNSEYNEGRLFFVTVFVITSIIKIYHVKKNSKNNNT